MKNSDEQTRFSSTILWDERDQVFIAACRELNVTGFGETREEALRELETAIEAALEAYEVKGWKVPAPSVRPKFSGQFRIRIPRSLHRWLSQEAEHEGVSLNTLVTTLLSAAKGELKPRGKTLSESVVDPKRKLFEEVLFTKVRLASFHGLLDRLSSDRPGHEHKSSTVRVAKSEGEAAAERTGSVDQAFSSPEFTHSQDDSIN